jgi:NAD(P)-dependent dehydrogenase (short-subunit alcohol dehydrogenase family)
MRTQKTYVVCGAVNRGIGEAITRLLVGQGHAVIGTYDKDHKVEARDLEKALPQVRLYEVDYASTAALAKFISKRRMT